MEGEEQQIRLIIDLDDDLKQLLSELVETLQTYLLE